MSPTPYLTVESVEELATEFITNVLREECISIDIHHILFYGSRAFGCPKENSDIDILLLYESEEEREDDLFDLFASKEYEIEGYHVDVNPVQVSAGDVPSYLGWVLTSVKQLHEEVDLDARE